MEKIIRSTPITSSRRLSDKTRTERLDAKNSVGPGGKSAEHGVNSHERQPVKDQTILTDIDTNAVRQEEVEDYASSLLEMDRSRIEQLINDNDTLQQQNEVLQQHLAKTEAQLNHIVEQNRTQGYEDGYAAGSEEGRHQFEQQSAELQELAAMLRAACDTQITDLESLAVEISLTALCRIIEDKIVDENYVVSWVRKVLMSARDESEVIVRVNPNQLEILRARQASLAEILQASKLNVVADSRVLLGGCMLETESGIRDGRLETQLQRLFDLAASTDKARLPS